MRTLDESLDAAVDRPPFSNGFEYEHWAANWCHRCLHDKGMRDDTTNPDGTVGCQLLIIPLCHGKTPSEWLEQDRGDLGNQYHCVEFRDEDDPGGYEPQPTPDPPGQELLLPREPYKGVRMLSQPSLAEVAS